VWQTGFWETAAPPLGLEPRVVATVSAGAATACVLFAGVAKESLRYFKHRATLNERNAYPRNFLSGQPVFPHERIYRDTILENLDDEALRRLHAGPDVRVLLARAPAWLGDRSGRRIGFVPEVVSVRDCHSPEEVADLILQSSCTPPFTTAHRRDSRPVLDGGLVDSVPVNAIDRSAQPTLVLLTQRYPSHSIPYVEGRTYVQPSEPIRIAAWDYTSPRGIETTYDLGRFDGERFAAAAHRSSVA
jgi:predicted acylesterase/phospholipase RssA